MIEEKEMRRVYCETLMSLAEKDERILNIQADLTPAHAMKPFQDRFPERSFDVGVAEANMVGVASGLATCGYIPFVHSFATFSSRRCFDQLAISVCYAGLNVKVIGSDPGVSAELNGGTHMALEDVGIMRTLPCMAIFEPTDSVQLRKALPVLVDHPSPVYIRLYRKKAENVFSEDYEFRFGKADPLRPGKDVVIFATGMCVTNALEAASTLAREGIDARVINVHTVKPLDEEAILEAARDTRAVVTAENHSVINGLGSAVAEVLAEKLPTPMERVGIKDHFGEVGCADYLMQAFGIRPGDIVAAVRKVVVRKAKLA